VRSMISSRREFAGAAALHSKFITIFSVSSFPRLL
jgi:hypothetical protein